MCGVTRGSAAAEAGLREGDRIIRANGEVIDSVGRVSASPPVSPVIFLFQQVYGIWSSYVADRRMACCRTFLCVSACSFERSFCFIDVAQ